MAWNIDLGFHNLMTCKGFESAGGMNLGAASLDIGGPCSMGKLGLVILFFLSAIVRKWGGEELGVPFSMLWANILGMGAYFLVITFTGSMKLSMLVGVAGLLIGGYLTGWLFDSGGEVNYE